MREVVRQAVHDIRTPPSPPAEPTADPTITAGRALGDELLATRHEIGKLMLTVDRHVPPTAPPPAGH
ncbi:hypothetical protein ACWFR1_38890 [Streptomyces sp. NPDC055103]